MYLRFDIDDNEYFRDKWQREGIPENNIQNLFNILPEKWCATVSLFGRKDDYPIKIKIENGDGKRMSLSSCSQYQKSIIDGCIKYFKDAKKRTNLPFAVVNMTDNINYVRRAV